MGSGSKGSTVTNTNTQPPPEVMEEYRNLIARGNTVGSQPYVPYTGERVASFSPEQISGIQGINAAQGIAQPYFDAARGYGEAGAAPITAEDLQRYQNPYQQQVVNATLGNLNLLNKQQQAGLEGNLMGSGGLFNDRLGVAQGQLAGQQATAEAPTIAGLESQGFTTALAGAQADRAAQGQAAYTFGNLGTANLSDILQGRQAQFGAGSAEQQLEQQRLNVPYEQFQQQQAFPYQQLSWLAQIASGLGSGMGGQSTSTTTPPKPWYQFWKDGGGIKGYDDGGGIGGLSPYPYGGAKSYIPAVSITHGPGPPKPAGAAQTKAQDPFGDISKAGKFTGLDKKASGLFDATKQGGIPDLMGMTDPSIEEAQQAGLASGLSADEVGLGAAGGEAAAAGAGDAAAAGAGAAAAEGDLDLSALFGLFALKDGGGIKLPRRGYAPGGDIDNADLPPGDDDTVPPDEAPIVPSRVSPEAGLGDLARAPVSSDTTRSGLPAGLSGLDPAGLAAKPSGAPLWPGETALPPPKPSSYPGMAGQVADQWREAGAKENAVKGVLYNVNAESGFRPDLRHPDQPRWTGEAHYAHGMYQHGGSQWNGLDRYSQQNGADWRDPRTQTAYEIENLKRTNPDVWRRMNEAPSWQEAAKIYARWLAPKKEYLDQREANIDRSSDPLHGYTGAEGRLPAGATIASGRAGDVGLKVRSASDGEGDGETTTTKGGLGRLFTADNALRFGLAMLANPTPYIGTAIGQAGLATLGASQEAERYGAKQAQEERKFKLDEKTKLARVKQIEDLAEYHKAQQERLGAREAERVKHDQDIAENMRLTQERLTKAQEAANERDKIRQAAEARKAGRELSGTLSPDQRWKINPDTGEPDPKLGAEPIPGGKLDPVTAAAKTRAIAEAKNAASMGVTIPPEQIELGAHQLVSGNSSALTNLPRTPQGLAIRNAYRGAALDMLRERGMTVQQAAAHLNNQEQEYKARGMGLNSQARTVGNRVANLRIINEQLNSDIQPALDANAKVTRFGGPITPLNRIIQHGEIMTSNPELVEFGMANLTLAEHWARAMNPTGVMRESDRDLALHFLDTGLSQGTYERAVRQLQKQVARNLDSVSKMDPRLPINPNEKAPAPGASEGGGDGGGGGPAPEKSVQRQKAEAWLAGHPDDPRAADIRKKLEAMP